MPGRQFKHSGEPSLGEYFATGQTIQSNDAWFGWAKPFGQLLQRAADVADASMYLPAGQAMQLSMVSAAKEADARPIGHLVQSASIESPPVSFWNLPLGQARQNRLSAAAVVLDHRPFPHSLHALLIGKREKLVVRLWRRIFSTSHSQRIFRHTSKRTYGSEMPLNVLYLPAMQSVQSLLLFNPGVIPTKPGAHSLHRSMMPFPTSSPNRPIGHALQPDVADDMPNSSAYLPRAQGKQADSTACASNPL